MFAQGFKLGMVADGYNPNTRRLKQEDPKFEPSLYYVERLCLKKNPSEIYAFSICEWSLPL
jgi:hypothetical protein